jgi:hypothetical protein
MPKLPTRRMPAHPSRTLIALAALISAVCIPALAADGSAIEYHESRSLGKLVGELWQRYGLLITYEEAPYDEKTEIVTDIYANGRRFRRPAWKPITFNGIGAGLADVRRGPSPAEQPPPDAASIAKSAVAEYNSSGNPGRFRVIKDGDYVHIVPDGRMRDGKIESFQPILDTKVTFVDSQPRLCLDVWKDLIAQIDNLRGINMTDNFPLGPLLHNTCLIQGADLTARAAFEQFFQQIELPQQNPISRFRYCWGLAYDINADMYFMTVYVVLQYSPGTLTTNVPAPVPAPAPPGPPGASINGMITGKRTVPPK